MSTFNDSKLSDNGLKLIKNLGIIAGLVLLSLIPNCSTQRLVQERMIYENQAIQSVISGWASTQSFGESSILIPTTEKDEYDPKSKTYSYKDNSFSFLPTHRDINITATHEYRKRGIFKIPVITTKTEMLNTFDVADMNRRIKNIDNSVAKNKPIELNIAHSNPNTITDFYVEIDGEKVPVKRSSAGIAILLEPVFLKKEKMVVKTYFTSKTYHEINLKVPQGENKITISSTWPHPSFEGQLPQEHVTTAKGFTANWSLYEPSPEQVLKVSFIEPVNIYSLNTRSLKYAMLITVLSLSLFFLFEILFQLQLHAMHYLLLSLPLSVFFILLVALSEHMAFGLSYMTASLATVVLMTTYLIGIGAAKKLASVFSIYLSMVYGVIYTLLNSEDYALLLGAVSIFIALAVFMLMTRKVNWRKLKIENATAHS